MKAIITGFFDKKGEATFNDQVEIAKSHHLNHICLRYYDHKPLLEASDKDVKDILDTLKNNKMKIGFIDTMIPAFDINNDQKASEAFDEFKYFVKLSDKLKVNYLMIKLPSFHDVIEEFENIEIRMTPWFLLALKQGKKILIEMDGEHKANAYQYIIKKMKLSHVFVMFNPVHFVKNHQSTTTSYRILKKNILGFYCQDADMTLEPKLIGYGKTDIINLLKKLIRDRFSGFLMMDNEFYTQVYAPQSEKQGLFKRVFTRSKQKGQKKIDQLSKKIFPNEQTKNATYDDILKNQIDVIKLIFKS